jgi:hypothetical protein
MGPLFDSSDRFSVVNEWFLVAKTVKQKPPSPTATK